MRIVQAEKAINRAPIKIRPPVGYFFSNQLPAHVPKNTNPVSSNPKLIKIPYFFTFYNLLPRVDSWPFLESF
jgi:hypothetical protein